MVSGRNIARAQKGFTMMELLGVVAIIAVVAAVAFPAYNAFQTNMRAMQLNSYAQQVYDTAQNRLSALQSNGQLYKLETAIGDTGKLQAAPTSPTAYAYGDGLSTSWSDYGMYAVTKSQSVTKTYLITDATSLGSSGTITGDYVIELSPSTGEVYAVYYWEDDATSTGGYASFDTNQLRTNHIGYYGGHSIDPAIDRNTSMSFKDLSLDVVNSEELYAKVYSADFGNTVFDSKNLSVTINVMGAGPNGLGSGSWSKTFTGGTGSLDIQVNTATNEIDIILDSMRTDLNFRKITEGNIYPGSKITVSVSVTYKGTTYDASNRTNMQPKTANSLFGNAGDKEIAASGTVEVSAVRHLNNLRSATTNYQYRSTVTGFNKIMQTADIDFDGTAWPAESVSFQSRSAGAVGYNPLSTFAAIALHTSINTGTNMNTNAIDGQSHYLKNFIITAGASYTGLFDRFYGSVSNVFMQNTQVTGGGSTGALIGLMNGPIVANCHNDVTDSSMLATRSVTGTSSFIGGLVGRYASDGSIANCTATTNVSGSSGEVGGLIGYIDSSNSTVANCSAGSAIDGAQAATAMTVTGQGTDVGGLIGYARCSSISSCTALANVQSTGSYIGGLIGAYTNWNGSLTDCQAGTGVADPAANTIVNVATANGAWVGGLAGQSYALTVTNCAALANVNAGNAFTGGLIGAEENDSATIENCSFGAGIGDASASTIASVTAQAYAGGLIGYCHAATVTGCSALGNVSGTGDVGGLLGRAYTGTMAVKNCTTGQGIAAPSRGTISTVIGSANYVGGLIGRSWAAEVSGCSALCNVSATGAWVGGIVGASENDSAVYDGCTVGDGIVNPAFDTVEVIAGNTSVGGIGGYFHGTQVSACTSLANITANGDVVGGLLGFCETSGLTVSDSSVGIGGTTLLSISGEGGYAGGLIGYAPNYTVVSGSHTLCTNVAAEGSSVGGLIGEQRYGTITNCYVIGNPGYDNANGGRIYVSSTDGGMVGGFGGRLYAVATEGCYTDANVSAASGSYVGGFAGLCDYGTVEHCYASGDTAGYSTVGGFAGRCGVADIDDCFTTSNVWGATTVGGFFGSLASSYKYSNDIAYGRVRNLSGTVPSKADNIGGFVGAYWYSSNSRLSASTYLGFSGYNEGISSTATAAYQPAASSYAALTANNDASMAAITHAYDANLKGSVFPFAFAAYDGSTLPYYGNWPVGVYRITFKSGNGATLQQSDVTAGATPSFATTSAAPDYVTSTTAGVKYLKLWNGTWKDADTGAAGIVAATKDTTYTAVYDSMAYPLVSDVLTSGTSLSGSKLFWAFLGVNGNGATTASKAADSEAPYDSKLGNAATSIRNSLYQEGFYTNTSSPATETPKYPANYSYSWRIHVLKQVFATENGAKNGISSTNKNDYEGNFVVYLGQKITPTSTDLQVVEYDVGRATMGLAAYRHGIMQVTNMNGSSQMGYYVYNDGTTNAPAGNTFVATSDWSTLG